MYTPSPLFAFIMKTLIIARHGNTFRKGETPTRVGSRTDLPLVEEERGRGIGRYLKKLGMQPNRILAAPLQRTLKTAELAAEELGFVGSVQPDARFIEVDYGPDENKTEDEVIARIGAEAIERWNAEALVPDGWKVDVAAIIANWQSLAAEVQDDETLLCVSSNGTIRFAPHLTGDYAAFCAAHDIKVPTGGVCIFTSEDGSTWSCREWGVKAFKNI